MKPSFGTPWEPPKSYVNRYSWRGSNDGGHVSFRQGDWTNCVFWWGCVGSIYPWIEIWVNGNGAWAQDQGG